MSAPGEGGGLAEFRAAVEAVVDRMRNRKVDHRHADETGHWGVRGRAYFYAGDIYDDYADLVRALDGTAATQEAPEDTCEDLGCVDGRTMQGRKYDYDGIAEEQWAPCGRRASTCPQEAPEDGEG